MIAFRIHINISIYFQQIIFTSVGCLCVSRDITCDPFKYYIFITRFCSGAIQTRSRLLGTLSAAKKQIMC